MLFNTVRMPGLTSAGITSAGITSAGQTGETLECLG